jgi:2,2-dialkylglycine decarboxylase (pyruvate)
MELGLSANIVRAGGSSGTMRVAPPLTVTDAELDLGIELLDAAISRAVPR